MACLIAPSLPTELQTKRHSVYFPCNQDLLRRLATGLELHQPTSHRRLQSEEEDEETLDEMHPVPGTHMEWKATLGEIKRDYVNRRFRQCSKRCQEILEYGDRLSEAHPVHLVYLRFYAATALEMQARALHHSSPRRTSLLNEAYDHLSVASTLAKQADEDMTGNSSRLASAFSSLHSSSASNASGSTASTRMSSPAPSLNAMDGTTSQSKPTRPKKRVAFCDDPIVEPIIRPDSPTLGFDEWLGRSSPEPVHPESILKVAKPLPSTTIPTSTEPPSPIQSEVEDTDPFFHTRSIHRFCTILSSIRRQITSHMTTLDIEIAACQIPSVSAHTSYEMRALDVKARIERLRACGWKRTRFDAQRYERLRENALADMME